MAKVDLEMALVKAQGRSPLSSEEMLELLGLDIGTLLTEHGMDLYQAEEVMMWRKHEALRWIAQLTSFPEPIQESKKLSIGALNKMILGRNNIIKEGLATEPTGRVEVEWDFFMDDDPGWNALSYEEQKAEADLPDIINIDPDVMSDYQADAAQYGEEQAKDMITNLLSDETGWLIQGWSWV